MSRGAGTGLAWIYLINVCQSLTHFQVWVELWDDRDNVIPLTVDYMSTFSHVNKFRKCCFKKWEHFTQNIFVVVAKNKTSVSKVHSCFIHQSGTCWFSLMSAKHSDSWFTGSSWVTSNQACGGFKGPLLLLHTLFPQGAFPSKSDMILTRMGKYSKPFERCKCILVTHSPSLCSSLQVSMMLMLPTGHLVWSRQYVNNETVHWQWRWDLKPELLMTSRYAL